MKLLALPLHSFSTTPAADHRGGGRCCVCWSDQPWGSCFCRHTRMDWYAPSSTRRGRRRTRRSSALGHPTRGWRTGAARRNHRCGRPQRPRLGRCCRRRGPAVVARAPSRRSPGCGSREAHWPVAIMVAMTRQKVSQGLVSDQLWVLLEPLIPPPLPAKNGRTGWSRIDDRAALEGILFVAEHGIAEEETSHRAGLRRRDHLLAPVAGLSGFRRCPGDRGGRADGAQPHVYFVRLGHGSERWHRR
jgi:hypothetical protein